MDQDKVAGKVLLELMSLGIVVEVDDQEIIFAYLLMTYAAGYNAGSKARSNKKPVMQLTMEGKPLEIYDSCADANRITKVDTSDISRCCRDLKRQAGGYKWKFVNIDKDGETDDSSISK